MIMEQLPSEEKKRLIARSIDEGVEVKKSLHSLSSDIVKFSDMVTDTLRKGNKILICGNGGSAADAQHFAAEFVVKFKLERKHLPAIALTTDSSILTAIINDFSGEEIYSRQIEALGNEGDVLVGISTSGKAKNVRNALIKARENGLKTIALTSTSPLGGEFAGLADLGVAVPSHTTARIQECHIAMLHIVMELVDKELFNL